MAPLSNRRLDPVWTAPLLFLITGMAFAAAPIINVLNHRELTLNKDYSHWYSLGMELRAGEGLYDRTMINGEVKYMYPPTLAVLFYTPLTHLGPVGFVVALAVITSCAWAVSVWASLVLLTGRWSGHPRWIYIVPGLAVGAYIYDIQLLGQINLVLLALLLLSMVALRGGRAVKAGLLFGLAAAMKAFPLTAIVYFVVRRQWKTVAVSLLAISLYVWFLPGLIRGFDRIGHELHQWAGRMIADQSGETISGRTSIGFTRRNHSLVSLSHRLLRHVNAGDQMGVDFTVNFTNLEPRTAQLIGYAACLVLGCVLLAATRLKFAPSPLAEGLEVGMVACMVVLCSPLSFTYFYCWLLPAWTAIAVMWNTPQLSQRSRRVVRCGGIVAGLFLISALSEQFDPTLQAYGVTTWGTVTLFLTMAFARFQLPNAAAVEASQPVLKLAA